MEKELFPTSRAIPVSYRFSSPKYSSWGGRAERGRFRDMGRKGEIHHVCGLLAGALPIRKEFRGEYATVRSGACTMSGTAVYLHEHQVGPARIWTSWICQHFEIRLDVGGYRGEIDVGPDWTQFLGGYFGLEGGDDGAQFPAVRGEELWTGGQWVRDYLPNRSGRAGE